MNLKIVIRKCFRRSGFTFFELLMAFIFLMTGLIFLFTVFSSSNRGTLDSHRETIAYTLAQEGLEWVSGLGYENLLAMSSTPGSSLETRFRLGTFVGIDNIKRDDGTMIVYPDDYKYFERKIEIVPFPSEKVIVVKVTVQPKTKLFTRRENVYLEKVVGAEYD